MTGARRCAGQRPIPGGEVRRGRRGRDYKGEGGVLRVWVRYRPKVDVPDISVRDCWSKTDVRQCSPATIGPRLPYVS
jgi:hypothetical protein